METGSGYYLLAVQLLFLVLDITYLGEFIQNNKSSFGRNLQGERKQVYRICNSNKFGTSVQRRTFKKLKKNITMLAIIAMDLVLELKGNFTDIVTMENPTTLLESPSTDNYYRLESPMLLLLLFVILEELN